MKTRTGKWVRYNAEGAMVKGWYQVKGAEAELYPDQAGKIYYYDHMTGMMAKGTITIDGITYHFDQITGELLSSVMFSLS